MFIPKEIPLIIDNDLLAKYLLNKKHYFGKRKDKFLSEIGFNKSNTNLLKEQLRSIVRLNNYAHLDSIFKAGLLYRIEYNGILKGTSKKGIHEKTYWKLSETNLEFLTLSIL